MNEKELCRAANLLKAEFGDDWQTIVQTLGTDNLRRRVGKELTSFMAFPERGDGGDNKWRGNCSPAVIEAVARYILDNKRYYGKSTDTFTLLDPMSGSGTSKTVADRLGIRSVLYDLNPFPAAGIGNWNALKNDVEDSADMIFLHPPYHGIIRYSGSMWGKPHPDDLSRCENYKDFIEKLNFVIKKLYMALRRDGRLAVLVGDIRCDGQFYSIQQDMLRMGSFESFIVKGQFNCNSDAKIYRKPFVPIVTEYLLLFRKDEIFAVPVSYRREQEYDILKTDAPSLSWHHLIRMTMESVGGKIRLADLYDMLAGHPKSRANGHYKERIRATIYEHKNQYINCGDGTYIKLHAVVPFKGQEAEWPLPIICRYRDALNRCSDVTTLHDEYKSEYYLERNRYLVDHCDLLLAVCDKDNIPLRSGTGATVRYAKKTSKPILFVKPVEGEML